MLNRTHQAFMCPCDATCPWTGNHYNDLFSSSASTRQNQNRSITSISRRTYGKLERIRTNQVNVKRCAPLDLVYLSFSNLKDPLAIELNWPRSSGHIETIRRCLPCCIPDSLRCKANYMFCNEYNVWCCSCTLCSHPRRKSADVLLQ